MHRSILFIAFVAVTVGVAQANETSQALVREGVAKLRAGDNAEALKLLREAEAADPKDAQALFLQGVILNRTPRDLDQLLRRPDEAYIQIRRAKDLGYQNADLSFELGWSLLKIQRWKQAVEALEAYEAAKPGRAQTSEFLGRAYMELGEFDKAEKLFDEALRRDASLQPTVRVFRMELERRRGNPEKALDQLRLLLQESPKSPVSSVLRDALAGRQLENLKVAKPWQLNLTVAGGWNSNVIALNDGTPLPGDISSRESAFWHVSLNFAQDLFRSEKESITAGYLVSLDGYEKDLNQYDLIDQYLYVIYNRKIDDQWYFGLRASDQHTIIGGDGFRNQIEARPSLLYRIDDDWMIELAYTYHTADYLTNTTTVSDRDAFGHTGLATVYWDIPDTKIRVRTGFFSTANHADGADYEFDRIGYFAGVNLPLGEKLKLDFSWTRTHDDYENLNSFAGFSTAREDDVDVLSAQLTHPINDTAVWFIQGTIIDDDSNISVFDYEQQAYMTGIVLNY